MKMRKVGCSVAALVMSRAVSAWAQEATPAPQGPPAAPPPAPAEAVSPGPLPPPPPPPPLPPAPALAPVVPPESGLPVRSRWETTLYGFVELDAMHDTTQSYGPASNNTVLARPGTYAGAHARTQITANNSQLGLRVAAPEYRCVRASGQAEIDFFGVQPTDATEQTAFTTPSVRMRLFYLRLETPFVDLLAGQYHDLFGWGGEGFYQNSVAFLGVAGEIYHRNPQVRISKHLGGRALALDIAAAAVRPVQRDSEVPDLQGGVKVTSSLLRGVSTQGFGQPDLAPVAVGVSGLWRRFAAAEFLTNPADARIAHGWGLAANAFLPVIPPRSPTDRSNALSITGEYSVGTGIADLYTGLTGGMLFPMLPDPSGSIQPPPIYHPNVDSGIVTFDANNNLETVDWTAFVVGLQYYLPVAAGRLWVSGTYSQLRSGNIVSLTPEASRFSVFLRQDYADGNVFVALTPAVQLGASYQYTQQTFGDVPFPTEVAPGVFANGPHPQSHNHRAELGLRLFF